MDYLEEIKNITNAIKVVELERVQDLWSGYGKIIRVGLKGAKYDSIIAKHIVLPNNNSHPRGWNTDFSHQRKIKSYQVETNWYKNYSKQTNLKCKVPNLIGYKIKEEEQLIVLEDLDVLGYSERRNQLKLSEVKLCLEWLANFHAKYLNVKPGGLWTVGSYWHLGTRPDEFDVMEDNELKRNAVLIDQRLNNTKYQTIIHGDAKVANFCFHESDNRVAAVDFQYIGGGCGMKDVAYLFSSCLTETECEIHEADLLGFYFSSLEKALDETDKTYIFSDIKCEWMDLYSIAWADFIRFLMGWMPTHHKLNKYSKKQVEKALDLIRK